MGLAGTGYKHNLHPFEDVGNCTEVSGILSLIELQPVTVFFTWALLHAPVPGIGKAGKGTRVTMVEAIVEVLTHRQSSTRTHAHSDTLSISAGTILNLSLLCVCLLI